MARKELNVPSLNNLDSVYAELLFNILSEKNDGMVYRIPETVRNSKDFALNLVSKNGMQIQHLSNKLKQDKDVVRTALSSDMRAIAYIDESVTREIILTWMNEVQED